MMSLSPELLSGPGDVEALPCVRTLRRADGLTWAVALAPVLADTARLPQGVEPNLAMLSDLVGRLLDELFRHPFPAFVVYVAPTGEFVLTPKLFASAFVSHRAERLVQCAELLAGTLAALERGELQLSAVAARALFELAVVCRDIHQPMLVPWRAIHGSVSRIRSAARSHDCETFRLVWNLRNSTRYYAEDHGWEAATSVLTRLQRLGRKVPEAKEIYDMLCDATHPNIESHATLWRTQHADIGGLHGIRFAPGSSNSKIKLYIVEAVRMSLIMIIPFVRDLWWVAADVTNTCNITPNEQTSLLGLPARSSRNGLCSCGSGLATKGCTHPEPEGLF